MLLTRELHAETAGLEDGVRMEVVLQGTETGEYGPAVRTAVDDLGRLASRLRDWRNVAVEQVEFGRSESRQSPRPRAGVTAPGGHEDDLAPPLQHIDAHGSHQAEATDHRQHDGHNGKEDDEHAKLAGDAFLTLNRRLHLVDAEAQIAQVTFAGGDLPAMCAAVEALLAAVERTSRAAVFTLHPRLGAQAMALALARGILWNPRWPWHAAKALGASVAIALVYLTLFGIGVTLGDGGRLAPVLAAWLANLIFLAAGITLFLKTPT